MQNKISNKNLEKIIKLKMVEQKANELEKIEEIYIQNKDLIGNSLNTDLEEIKILTNLKRISLKYFKIDDKAMQILNSMRYLTYIEFLMCEFSTDIKIENQLRYCNIYCCNNFKQHILSEQNEIEDLSIESSGLVDMEKLTTFNNIKYLKISDCNVISLPSVKKMITLEKLYLHDINLYDDIEIINMKNLKFVSLNGCKVENKEKYKEKLKKQNANIEIEFRENSLPIE